MKLNDWNVMINKQGHHHYFYGPLSEFEPDELKGLRGPLSQLQWNAEDYATILGNILEDRNYHRFCHTPTILLDVLDNAELSDEQKKFVMQDYAERILSEYL